MGEKWCVSEFLTFFVVWVKVIAGLVWLSVVINCAVSIYF